MCCFTGPVLEVCDTRIFARDLGQGRQALIYEMRLSTDVDVAMVLPLPVPLGTPADAVEFVSLAGYRRFFDHLAKLVPKAPPTHIRLGGGPSRTLPVHSVGKFDASFLPSTDDFKLLDPRFRLPASFFDQLPSYLDWGFAVFQLKDFSRDAMQTAHPMALTFPRRDPDALFLPTVHVHDGETHPEARFHHSLYVQQVQPPGKHWRPGKAPAAGKLDVTKVSGLVDLDTPVWGLDLEGWFTNTDTWVKPPGNRAPQPEAARLPEWAKLHPERWLPRPTDGEGGLPNTAWLVGLDGPHAGATFQLAQLGTVVGSAPDVTVRLDDSAVAGHHCCIFPTELGWRFEAFRACDLRVNDKPAVDGELYDNTELTIGATRFRVKMIG